MVSSVKASAPPLDTPMAEPESPVALSDLSVAAERMATTARALMIARHAHEDATLQFNSALDRVAHLREQEGT
jgi:hypothetical protein